jgi:HAD superfamily hydrolase (TIGR01450 family)
MSWQHGVRALAIDLDGVVYRGEEALPGAVEAVARLRARGFGVGFVTNGSGAGAPDYVSKLRRLGVPCEERELVSSGTEALRTVARRALDAGRGVFLVGTPKLAEEARRLGVAVTTEEACGAVVVGLCPGFDAGLLERAARALARGVPLVGANRDEDYPAADGRRLPGCGPVLRAVEEAAGRMADHVAGKPGLAMLEALAERLGVPVREWGVVGDGVESDLALARNAGVPGLYVGEGSPPGAAASYRSLAMLAAEAP